MPTLTEKTCSDCKQIKPVSAFSRRAKSLDGLQPKCKQCCAALKKEWLVKNVDHVAAYQAEYSKAYRTENASRLADAKRQYHAENCVEITAKVLAWQKANPERVNAKNRQWERQHPAKSNAKSACRRARILKATPKWADNAAIAKVYELAAKMTEVHVDHVVPLKSKFVCGLHVPANLEIIAKSDNLAKSNRVWPGMP